MVEGLAPNPFFERPSGPVVIVVADGVGVGPPGPQNAVTEARTPHLDALLATRLSTPIAAHGLAVGLPSDDDMGNSEVGHNALGAGRIFPQGATLVNKAINSGSIWKSEPWLKCMQYAAREGATLHLLGLHSDGNVHAHTDHLYALVSRAASEGISRVRLHILLDGRDVPERSALTYVKETEHRLDDLNRRYHVDYAIGSGGGRMAITMDRYGADWAMVEAGYRCHTHGQARGFASATQAIEVMYLETELGDQYLAPFVVEDSSGEPIGVMADGDAVILWNFRGDRAIEISRAYEDPDLDVIDRAPSRNVCFAGMLEYDGDLKIPRSYLVNPPSIENTMGEYLAATGRRGFAVSETQKYGHVTYFWNGNRSGYIDEQLERYVEVPSDNIAFDQAPAMKAEQIASETVAMIASGEFDWGRLNFANGDMVGHTGNLQATIESIETMDLALGRVIEAIDLAKGVLIFTADHGNADIMYTTSNGTRSPKTSHTLSPVPFAVHGYGLERVVLAPIAGPGLANVAATAISLMGLTPPAEYRPSLVDFNSG